MESDWRALLFLLLFIVMTTVPFYGMGQRLTSEELIQAWQTSDTSQTNKAELTYADLKQHAQKQAFSKLINELQRYINANPDLRLEARMRMYALLGKRELGVPINQQDIDHLKKAITQAGLLKDQQLLSEQYSLYADYSGNLERALFYNLKCIHIQSRIGAEHFPMLYRRYMAASEKFYRTGDYRASIEMGLSTISLMTRPEKHLKIYVWQLDLLGAAYKQLSLPDSTIYYYQKLMNTVLFSRSEAPQWDSDLQKLWLGIAKGGIGAGLVLKKQYDAAYPLLQQNIASSLSLDELGDAAMAQNLLAGIEATRGNRVQAIRLWRQSLSWADSARDLNQQLEAAKGIMDAYYNNKDYGPAFEFSRIYYSLRDTLSNRIAKGQLDQIKAQIDYDTMKSTLQVAERHVQTLERLRNFILILLGTAAVGAIWLIRRRQKKNRRLFRSLEYSQRRTAREALLAKKQVFETERKLEAVQMEAVSKNELIDRLQTEKRHTELLELKIALRNCTLLTEQDWYAFKDGFDKAYPHFWDNLKDYMSAPTPGELRFMALSKLRMDNKQIAAATGVSAESVRILVYRMKKKYSSLTDPRKLAESL